MANSRRASVIEGDNPAEGGKRKRRPIHDRKNVLTVKNQDPNFVYRWVNDVKEGTRLETFLEAGYQFVDKNGKEVGDPTAAQETPVDSRLSKVVGVDKSLREPVRAYYMRIPREFYEEDQAAKMADLEETERAMFQRANLPDEDVEEDGFYGKFKREKV